MSLQVTIRSIFLFLDRSYLYGVRGREDLETAAVSLFRKHIIEGPVLRSRVHGDFLHLFAVERAGPATTTDTAEFDLLRSFIAMAVDLALYDSVVKPSLIDATRVHFERLAETESRACSLEGYIGVCSTQLNAEAARCDRLRLDPATKRHLVDVVQDEMVAKKVPDLTKKALVRGLLNKGHRDSLATLFGILSRVQNPGRWLRAGWVDYIQAEGTKIILDQNKDGDMVARLLDLKASLDTVWRGPFSSDPVIGVALRDAFSTFINTNRVGSVLVDFSKPAELLAHYVDHLLRRGAGSLPPVSSAWPPARPGATPPPPPPPPSPPARDELNSGASAEEAALADRLELVLDLFRFLQGKDVFEAFYKKDLARRLLLGRSASIDAEKLMLAKMKTECGAGFTQNLEAMFRDIHLSRESLLSFNASKAGMDQEACSGVDLQVHVLSIAAWPSYPEVTVNIPPSLNDHMEAFARFYVDKHQGRKLTWRPSLSHCVLKADFPKVSFPPPPCPLPRLPRF